MTCLAPGINKHPEVARIYFDGLKADDMQV